MTNTPRLGIGMMATNDLQKEVIFNEAIIAFDALVARSVKERRNSAPSSPLAGDSYIVGAAPTGVWGGHANEIAFWYNGWRYITPTEKMKFFVELTSTFWTYNAPNWTQDAAGTPTVLADLSDVAATSPSNGDVLVYEDGAWQAGQPPAAVTSLDALTDVEVSGMENGDLLGWNEGLGKWSIVNPVFGAQVIGDLNDVTTSGADTGDVLTYISGGWEARPAPTSLFNVVTSLLDVDTTGVQPNDALVWNGAVWAPSSVVFNYSFQGMMDGPGTMEGYANHFMIVDPTESVLQFISLDDLLETSDFKLQSLADLPPNGDITDADIGKFVQLYKDGSDYKFQYTVVDYSIPLFVDTDEITPRITKLTLNGFDITETDGEVTVTNQNAVEYRAASNPVGGETISAIDFTGPGVGVTNDDGTLVVTITGSGGTLEELEDVDLSTPAQNGDALVYDAIEGKWVPGEGAASMPAIDGEAEAALYEFGPFAPPTPAMFPLRHQAPAGAAAMTSIPNRGLMTQPGTQPAGVRHSAVLRNLQNNSAPWMATTRVVPSGRVNGHAVGICLQRSANLAMVFITLGESASDTQTIMRFGHVNASGVETVTTSHASEWNWLRIGYNGNDIQAWVSADGLLWHLFGTLGAAAVLGGPPDRIGIVNRSNAAHSGNVGALVTFYEDPDFPAGSRISNGVVSLGLGGLLDVDLVSTPPTNGQTIVWDEAEETWVPGEAVGGGGGGSIASLSDVDLSTAPTNGQALIWDETSSRWVAGAGGDGTDEVDISVFLAGVPEEDETVLVFVVNRPFFIHAGAPNSIARAMTAPTAEIEFVIRRNGSIIGTITFDEDIEGVFDFEDLVEFDVGDLLTISSPVSVFGMADVGLTLSGVRT